MSNLILSARSALGRLNIRRLELEAKAFETVDKTRVGRAINYVAENPKKSMTVAAVGITTVAAAYTAAPVMASKIGAAGVLGATKTTGVKIGSLHGVPLANASLAKLGGGALSVGGSGVAGGKAVISSVLGLVGTTVAAEVVPEDINMAVGLKRIL